MAKKQKHPQSVSKYNRTTTTVGIAAFIVALGSLCLNLINLSRLTTPTISTTITEGKQQKQQLPYQNGPNELISQYLSSQTGTERQSNSISPPEKRISTSTAQQGRGGGEEAQWNEIMHRSVISLEECNNNINRTNTKKSTTNKAKTLPQLQSFDFMNTLSTYISEDSFGQCQVSPSTSCDVTEYSILITYQHTHIINENNNDRLSSNQNPLRVLFLNLLTFLTYPSAIEILIVVLPDTTTTTLSRANFKNNVKYGTRMLSWDRDDSHKVKFVFMDDDNEIDKRSKEQNNNDLWTSLGQLSSVLISESIVWIDGNAEWNGNRRSIDLVGFQLWKRYSQSLIFSSSSNMEIQNEPEWYQSKRQQLLLQRHKQLQQKQALPVTAATTMSNEYLPICQDTNLVLYHYSSMDKQQQSQQLQLMDVSGLFFHRNMLCFLSHAVFSAFRQYVRQQQQTQNQDYYYHVQKVAISIVFTQLSGEIPRMYPRNVVEQRMPTVVSKPALAAATKEEGQKPPAAQPNNDPMKIIKKPTNATTGTLRGAATSPEDSLPKKSSAGNTNMNNVMDKSSHIIATEKINTKEKKNSAGGNKLGKKKKGKKDGKNKTRTANDPKDRLVDTNDAQDSKTITTKKRQPRRLLMEVFKSQDQKNNNEINISIDNDTLTTMFGFFGSVVPGFVGWCVGSSSSQKSSQDGQYYCDPMDRVAIGSIPWMNKGGFGNEICLQ